MPLPPIRLARLATEACLLEAAAPKPGNVSPGRPFGDMRYEDFVASAEAAGPELGRAGERPLGETILAAADATRRRTAANTNLGILLLLAPLARAAARVDDPAADLRGSLRQVLEETTVPDAAAVYRAIRIAGPGGLGTAADQDVATDPGVTLREAMALAAERDTIAREYVTAFEVTFGTGAPALRQGLAAGLETGEAIVETFLTLLARVPDTLIARKLGPEAARAVSARAGEVLAAGGPRTSAGRARLARFDAELRDPHNSHNPGTTADLTAAALFVVLLEQGPADPPLRMPRAQ